MFYSFCLKGWKEPTRRSCVSNLIPLRMMWENRVGTTSKPSVAPPWFLLILKIPCPTNTFKCFRSHLSAPSRRVAITTITGTNNDTLPLLRCIREFLTGHNEPLYDFRKFGTSNGFSHGYQWGWPSRIEDKILTADHFLERSRAIWAWKRATTVPQVTVNGVVFYFGGQHARYIAVESRIKKYQLDNGSFEISFWIMNVLLHLVPSPSPFLPVTLFRTVFLFIQPSIIPASTRCPNRYVIVSPKTTGIVNVDLDIFCRANIYVWYGECFS